MKDEMTKPLVVHYNSSYLPLTEIWIYNQVKFLKEFFVAFISRKRRNQEMFPILKLFALDELSSTQRVYNLLFFKIIGYIPRFASYIRESQLLHVHFGNHGAKMVGLKRHLNIPMVVSFYGADAYLFPFRNRMNVKRLRKTFHHADRILVLGPHMKDSLVKLGCPESKIVIHHLGVDTEKLPYKKREYDPSRPIRFLLASSFVEKKGVDICLKALSNL